MKYHNIESVISGPQTKSSAVVDAGEKPIQAMSDWNSVILVSGNGVRIFS